MSIATEIIDALARDEEHPGENVSFMPSRHLRAFLSTDGRLFCFIRELSCYIRLVESKQGHNCDGNYVCWPDCAKCQPTIAANKIPAIDEHE